MFTPLTNLSPTKQFSPSSQTRMSDIIAAFRQFRVEYNQRFFYDPRDQNGNKLGNSFASGELVRGIKTLFESVPLQSIEKLIHYPVLKDQFQFTLMDFYRQLVDLDAQRTLENNSDDLNTLEEAQQIVFQHHLANLENFSDYIKSSNRYLLAFRFLFPLADNYPNLPQELHQGSVKPFLDLVQRIYQQVFNPSVTPVGEMRAGVKRKRLFENHPNTPDDTKPKGPLF